MSRTCYILTNFRQTPSVNEKLLIARNNEIYSIQATGTKKFCLSFFGRRFRIPSSSSSTRSSQTTGEENWSRNRKIERKLSSSEASPVWRERISGKGKNSGTEKTLFLFFCLQSLHIRILNLNSQIAASSSHDEGELKLLLYQRE